MSQRVESPTFPVSVGIYCPLLRMGWHKVFRDLYGPPQWGDGVGSRNGPKV